MTTGWRPRRLAAWAAVALGLAACETLPPNVLVKSAAVEPAEAAKSVGNDQVGEGRMKIVDSRPNRSVTIALEMQKPVPATNHVTFTLFPLDGGTRVNWSMKGGNGFLGKAMSLAMDMDALVGKDFEQGLANLDKAARKAE